MEEKESESQPTKTEPQEPTPSEQVLSALGQQATAPDKVQIEAWKSLHGDVYVSAFSEEEVFIFKSVNRKEYRQCQEASAESRDPAVFEDMIIESCLLWTSVKDLDSKGGTIPALLEQILQHSNFVAPQVAVQLVAKL